MDFVLYGPSGIYAIEVKNTARLNLKDFRGLKAFGQDYPEAKRILLYRGKESLVKEGISCLPCESFLKNLVPEHPPI